MENKEYSCWNCGNEIEEWQDQCDDCEEEEDAEADYEHVSELRDSVRDYAEKLIEQEPDYIKEMFWENMKDWSEDF